MEDREFENVLWEALDGLAPQVTPPPAIQKEHIATIPVEEPVEIVPHIQADEVVELIVLAELVAPIRVEENIRDTAS